MKVLLVSHACVVNANRAKARELCGIPGVELRLVVPHEWGHALRHLVAEPAEDGAGYDLCVETVVRNGDESGHFYFPSVRMGIPCWRPDLVHVEQGAAALAYTQAIAACRLLKPRPKCVFFTWHNLAYRIRRPWLWLRERYNLARSDGAFVGSRNAARVLRARGFEGPLKVLPQLGVALPGSAAGPGPAARDRASGPGFTIGYAGRFLEKKGLLTLVRAVAGLPEQCRLLLVGGGALRGQILQLARQLGIEGRVRIVDAVPHTEVAGYLRQMDVFVLPSESTSTWAEQFGHVLIEAMALGVPVVGARSGEIPAVIGEAGLLFDERDIEGLRGCLQRLLRDESERDRLARAGIERVRREYTHKRIAAETYSFYTELLGDGGERR